jgi:hypothetical protein
VKTQTHESLTSFRRTSASSERKFGLTVGAIFVVLSVWPWLRHHQPVRVWLLVIGLLLAGFGLAYPKVLAPLNRVWFAFGLLLARVTNPIVMGAMFFFAVVPFAWFLRARGADLLRLKRDSEASTYWIERDPNAPTSLAKQF